MPSDLGLSEQFLALNDEASFTNEVLSSGIQQLQGTSYAKKGTYFSAFSGISIGLERLGKLSIILNHVIHNDGEFPNDREVRSIGHDLVELYERLKNISLENEIAFRFKNGLDEEIYQNVLSILNGFSKGERYANIDFLVGGRYKAADPISEWYSKVDGYIYENMIEDRKKSKIERDASVVDSLMKNLSTVLHFSESGEIIRDAYTASFESGKVDSVIPVRQLIVLHIARYFIEVLVQLSYMCQKQGNHDIPFFSEHFAFYLNDDNYLKTRKTIGS